MDWAQDEPQKNNRTEQDRYSPGEGKPQQKIGSDSGSDSGTGKNESRNRKNNTMKKTAEAPHLALISTTLDGNTNTKRCLEFNKSRAVYGPASAVYTATHQNLKASERGYDAGHQLKSRRPKSLSAARTAGNKASTKPLTDPAVLDRI